MQSHHTTSTTSPSRFHAFGGDSDLRPPHMKSPNRSTFLKKKGAKDSSNTENQEPNQLKQLSSTESNSNSIAFENRQFPSTPGKSRQEMTPSDSMMAPREPGTASKPAESPFTAFCKGLTLSPSPMTGISPMFHGKNNYLFGGRDNFGTPSLNLFGTENHSSPINNKKVISNLDFTSNRFSMFKNNKDDMTMEQEEAHDKYGNNNFEQNLTYEDNIVSSPKFSFPMKKSIYTNKNLIPTQSRNNDIYSSPTRKANKKDSLDKEESALALDSDKLHEEANLEALKLNSEEFKTPSPARKASMDASNTFGLKNEGPATIRASLPSDSLLINKTVSFGMGNPVLATDFNAGNISEKSSVAKTKADEEEEDEAAAEEAKKAANKKVCCNCKKSRCLKLYCDCFARGTGCTKDCSCMNCLNNDANDEERKAAMMNTLERNPLAFKPKVNNDAGDEKIEAKDKAKHIKGCNCKKSGCLKKYCECFQAGAKCTDMCKCENCKNMDPNSKGGCGDHGGAVDEIEKSDIKTNARSFDMFNEDDIYEGSSDEDEARKYANPRKQFYSGEKDSSGNMIFQDDDGDKNKNGKSKDKKRKGSTAGQPKTPVSAYNDLQRKKIDFTPSPEKQSISGGRARRNVRPFGHINPDFEVGK